VSNKPTFVIKLRPTPLCKDAYKALRLMLKSAFRLHGLRAIKITEEIPSPESAEKLSGISPADNYAKGGETHNV
jgi:hypothetical protein